MEYGSSSLATGTRARQQYQSRHRRTCMDNAPGNESDSSICEQFNIPLVEDAAEALGSCYCGSPAGSMGAYSFFSFNGNKIITTSGGGMLLSNNGEGIKQARYLATQAREAVVHYEHKAIGYNYRMSNLLAGLGNSQLADLLVVLPPRSLRGLSRRARTATWYRIYTSRGS